MSDNQPSGTLGGMIASLFRGKTNDDGTPSGGFTSKHTLLSGALLAAISGAKNQSISPERYARNAEGYFESVAARVYTRYQELLDENHALDFDDLLGKVLIDEGSRVIGLSVVREQIRKFL